MNRYQIILFLTLLSTGLVAQKLGCTDNQAINYDPQAEINDGSCIYSQTIDRPTEICQLESNLNETSGLEVVNQQLISLNDSDNDPIIYFFNQKNCQGIEQHQVPQTDNIDWEELAHYKGKIYIGDFGNNAGRRKNLRIFITDSTFSQVDTINFSFEDQKKFMWFSGNHPYDCEAMFVDRDSIHLFTKDRLYMRTRHYRLPINPGDYQAQLIDSFFVDGLITAADISNSGIVSLLGYRTNGAVFQYLLFDYKPGQYFSGNKREILLGSGLDLGQTESLVFINDYQYYITNERNFGLEPRLFTGDCKEYTDHITSVHSTQVIDHIYYTQQNIVISLNQPTQMSWSIYHISGHMIANGKADINRTHSIPLSDSIRGIFFLELKWKNNKKDHRRILPFYE